MRFLTVLYGGALAREAFMDVLAGEPAAALALRQAAAFPYSEKTVLLARAGDSSGDSGMSALSKIAAAEKAELALRPEWNTAELLKTLSELGAGYDGVYYAWADSPFLDPLLAGKIAGRHTRYAAEYSFADGWPGGLGPEIVTSASAGILYKIAGEAGAEPVRRDSLFTVLQKDINAFDIETELADVDLRHLRLSFTADSKRNLLLLRRCAEAFSQNRKNFADCIPGLIEQHPEYLRTLPAFFPVQVSGACPNKREDPGRPEGVPRARGSCGLCPYPLFGGAGVDGSGQNDFLSVHAFSVLLDKIEAFAGDGVVDISLWGETALHPERERLMELVLERPALALVVETSGYGWTDFDMAGIAAQAERAEPRLNGLPALSWIVSLHPSDVPQGTAGGPAGAGGEEREAAAFVQKLVQFFPTTNQTGDRVYVEAVRVSGEEDAVEHFYRAWKAYAGNEKAPGIIIQKYDSFCGFLPQKQTVDLSPVERRPCWHLTRDFPVYLTGEVPLCRENLTDTAELLGNAFKEDLDELWKRGESAYLSQCEKIYNGVCKVCDEYYTYNF